MDTDPRMSDPVVTLWTEVDLPGFHHWPDPPPWRSYLAARHRHLFRVRLEVLGAMDDRREVEFHDLQDWLREWWGPRDREFGARSCESIAGMIRADLIVSGYEPVRVGVSEDNQSGAVLEG